MLNCAINPLLLRQFWSVVEATQANILLHLDDSTLVRHLTHDLRVQQLLDAEEEIDRLSRESSETERFRPGQGD